MAFPCEGNNLNCREKYSKFCFECELHVPISALADPGAGGVTFGGPSVHLGAQQ